MNALEENVLNLLGKDEIEAMARNTGFVERKSPITGTAFLLAMMAGTQGAAEGTLTELATFLFATGDIKISPQAMDARFNSNAAAFLESCLNKALALLRTSSHRFGILSKFNHIYAIDSTNFNLAPELAPIFKGNGGGASKAAMRIQFVLDYCTEAMYLEIGDVRLSDPATLAGIVRDGKIPLDGNSLILPDLGYFKSSTFAYISSQEGLFFLSKMNSGVHIYRENGDLLDLDEKLKKNPTRFEDVILIGGAKCRLVAVRLDDETAGQRIRKANSCSESKSGQITEKYRRFLHYSMFITNLPAEYTMEQLYTLYRIRWQVELVFKSWKSVLGIDRQRSAKHSRVMCEVYGKLIAATLVSLLERATEMDMGHIVISRIKATKTIKIHAAMLASAVMEGKEAILIVIKRITASMGRLCRKNEGKTRPTIEQRLENSLGGSSNEMAA
jgi:hypothetical protein